MMQRPTGKSIFAVNGAITFCEDETQLARLPYKEIELLINETKSTLDVRINDCPRKVCEIKTCNAAC